ncbi:MAG: hypothetical protein FK733_06125 [Asgard group archaeon]|nr:hypothetical protein [Asgard group archaeon]
MRIKVSYLLILFLVILPIVSLSSKIRINYVETISSHDGECSIITCKVGEDVLYGYNYDGHEYLEPFIQFGDHMNFQDGDIVDFGKPICTTGRMTEIGPRDLYARITDDGLGIAFNSLESIQMFVDPLKENRTDDFELVNECSNVQEVIEFFNQSNSFYPSPNPTWSWQKHIVDAYGEAIVVGLNEFGEVTITEMNESQFLISANQNLAYPDNCDGPCSDSINRVNIATSMLEPIVAGNNLSVDSIRDVLEALSCSSTTHSLIFNPKTLDIYAYYRQDFTKVFEFNIAEELNSLASGELKFYDLKELYTNTTNQLSITSTVASMIGLFIIVFTIRNRKKVKDYIFN